jgi:hypothetical protein
VPASATLRGAVPGLARNGVRRALASVGTWMEGGLPAAATPHRAILGLAREGGRCALTSVHAWTEGVPVAAHPGHSVLPNQSVRYFGSQRNSVPQKIGTDRFLSKISTEKIKFGFDIYQKIPN